MKRSLPEGSAFRVCCWVPTVVFNLDSLSLNTEMEACGFCFVPCLVNLEVGDSDAKEEGWVIGSEEHQSWGDSDVSITFK